MFDPRFVNRERRYGVTHEHNVFPLGVRRAVFRNGILHEDDFVATYPGCNHSGNHPPGGACDACGLVSCQACIARCVKCGASLCPKHTVTREGPHCPECDRQERALGLVLGFLGVLLSPLLEFTHERDRSWLD